MDLKPIVDEITRDKEIKGSWKLKHLISLFTALSKLDKQSEKLRKRYGCLSLVCLPIMIAAVIAGLATETYYPFIGLAVVIIVFIIFKVRHSKAKKSDIENDFRLFALPFFRDISEDVDPTQKISVTIPVTPLQSDDNLENISEKYSKGVYYDCVDYLYCRGFLDARIPLRDGNALQFSGKLYRKNMSRTKQTIRKIKTKMKQKEWAQVAMTLHVNPERYTCDETAYKTSPNAKDKISVRRKGDREIICLKYVQIINRSTRVPVASSDVALTKLLNIYGMLRAKA